MSVFAVGIIMAIAGIILMLGGWFLADSPRWSGLGLFIVVIGILLVIGANLHVYVNGTEQDLIRWLFWSR